jgi:hypothetical protein
MDDVWQHYQRLAAIRNSVDALNTGEYESLLADDNAHVFAFRRYNDKQTAIIATNDSNQQQEVEVPSVVAKSNYVDVLNDAAVKVAVAKDTGARRTHIEIGAGAKRIAPGADGKLKVALPAHTTAILVAQ